jgi:pimeloyl-ACP methyl ester carboxylesterase
MLLARLNRWPFRVLGYVLRALGMMTLILAGLLAFPLRQPPELPSITAGVRQVDRSDLPGLHRFQARDGTELAFRLYEPSTPKDGHLVVLVHGSAGHSANMHAIGKGMAQAGIVAVALDMRGHGSSGTRGDIGYIGQLEDDLADLIGHLRPLYPQARRTLIGHSAGGGFALRVAGSALGELFDRYVLLAPFLGPFAPTARPNAGAALWVEPDVPRIIALGMLRRFGIECCESLPVLAFALPPGSAQRATVRYSYRLQTNFGPHSDFRSDFSGARRPIVVIAGERDELMDASRYDEATKGTGRDARTIVLRDIDHMGIVSDPAAIAAIVQTIEN